MDKQSLKTFLVARLRGLPKPVQMAFIDELIQGIKETVSDLGLGHVEVSTAKIPSDTMPDEIKDLLQKLRDKADGDEPQIHIKKLEGDALDSFMDMLRENGMKMPSSVEEFKEYDMFKNVKRDDSVKQVGDSVVIMDVMAVNYMHDYETKEQLSKNFSVPKENFKDVPAIVIEVNTEFIFNCGHCDTDHKSDLVIFVPSLDRKFHAMSRSLRIL
jgi:hypothetical protein